MTQSTRTRSATGRAGSGDGRRSAARTATPEVERAAETAAAKAAKAAETTEMTETTTTQTRTEAAATTETPPAGAAAAPQVVAPRGLTLRLPFLTVTLGPQPPAPAAAGTPGTRGRLEKAAFYGGVATLGIVGVLDWPVAAAVAAGTWVAQHTLPRPRQDPPRRS